MDYHLSEDELNRLNDCRRQVLLIWDLCGYVKDKEMIAVGGLKGFVDMLDDVLGDIATAVEKRAELERDSSENRMSWVHWMHALTIASGDHVHVPYGIENSITAALAAKAAIDADWQMVADKWAVVSAPRAPAPVDQAASPAATVAAPRPTNRRRDRLTAGA